MKLTYHDVVKSCTIDDFCDICNMYTEIVLLGIKEKEKLIKQNYAALSECDETCIEDEYRKLNLFKYRCELLLICCLSEVWEQNLFLLLKNIYDDPQIRLSGQRKPVINSYDIIKQLCKEWLNTDIDSYKTISEMRRFTNTIKHGLGRSLEKLEQEIGESIYLDSNWGKIESCGQKQTYKEIAFACGTLNAETLNATGKLQEFVAAVEMFWIDLNNEVNSRRI